MRHKRNLFAAFGVAGHSKALGLAASVAWKATKIFPLEVEDFSRGEWKRQGTGVYRLARVWQKCPHPPCFSGFREKHIVFGWHRLFYHADLPKTILIYS